MSDHHETNPFFRASYLQARPPPAYEAPPDTPTVPVRTILGDPSTTNHPTTHVVLDSASSIGGGGGSPVMVASPVPAYSRSIPQAHAVVQPEIVARMPSNYNLEEANASLDCDVGGVAGGDVTTTPPPPPYAPPSLPVKSAGGAQAEEEAMCRALGVRVVDADAELGMAGYGVMHEVYLTDVNQLRIGHLRSNEVREANEAARRGIESSNSRRERMRRAGGVWAWLRWCVPRGRKTVSHSNTRNWVITLGVAALAMIIVAVVLVVRAVSIKPDGGSGGRAEELRKGGGARPEAKFLTVGSNPPIPTGVMVVQPTGLPQMIRSCVAPPEMWSCGTPPGTSTAANTIPEFRFEIRHRGTDAQKKGPESVWAPRPENVLPVDYMETAGVDGRAANSSGIPTEFVITLHNNNEYLPVPKPKTSSKSGSTILEKSTDQENEDEDEEESNDQELHAREFLERDLLMKRASTSLSDPSKTPPNMLPALLKNQQLRLMDAGLASEHYTTHMYYYKSIYLDGLLRNPNTNTTTPTPATAPLNHEVPGSSPSAKFACIFTFTRFKIKIFTQSSSGGKVIVDQEGARLGLDGGYGKGMVNTRDAVMPLPVTISEDRAGGSKNAAGRNVMCYAIESVGDDGSKRLGTRLTWPERTLNPVGQVEGRERGCLCEWGNWRDRGRLDV
ncbi:hypothetical protein DFH27DRAFT_629499 [Peziza echinospora]|nr:hypothetical protein DFH27DRAFT_629499 [Peziza echinospora]